MSRRLRQRIGRRRARRSTWQWAARFLRREIGYQPPRTVRHDLAVYAWGQIRAFERRHIHGDPQSPPPVGLLGADL